MVGFALKRLGVALLVALTVSLVTFSMIYVSGDPALAIAGEGARAEDIENVRKFYGFDRPIAVQYFDWLWNALQGDLGRSYNLRRPVAEVIFARLPVTMLLGACAISFALVLAIPLGVLAAVKPNSVLDRMALTLAVIGQAMPSFWFALTLILWLGVTWRLLPITGQDSWANFVMPSIALGYYVTPAVMRLTRAGMLRARQGPAAHDSALQAWFAECHHPRRRTRRRSVRLHARRFDRHRDDLPDQRAGLPRLGVDPAQGPAHDAGDRSRALHHLCRADLLRRHAQRVPRSAHPGGLTWRMSVP
jgi:Binding-prot-dependent transport system membrane comp, N-term/Binding-protein-dependent transport system inner membrane component